MHLFVKLIYPFCRLFTDILLSVFSGSNIQYITERGGKFALVFISNLICNFRNRGLGLPEQSRRLPDAVLFHISTDRLSIDAFESAFQSGRIDKELFRSVNQ